MRYQQHSCVDCRHVDLCFRKDPGALPDGDVSFLHVCVGVPNDQGAHTGCGGFTHGPPESRRAAQRGLPVPARSTGQQTAQRPRAVGVPPAAPLRLRVGPPRLHTVTASPPSPSRKRWRRVSAHPSAGGSKSSSVRTRTRRRSR